MGFFREVVPQPVVGKVTLLARLHRGLQKHGCYEDQWLEEAIFLTPEQYKLKYGQRRSWLNIDGQKRDLAEIYGGLTDRNIDYPLFRQRLRKRDSVTGEMVRNAATMTLEDWITHYGGGRRKGFTYRGELHPNAHGTFTSVTSFLKKIDRYEDKNAIHARLKRGWDVDDALSRPPIERDGCYSLVYVITQISTGLQYVGNSVRGERTRWREHRKSAFVEDAQTYLCRAMRQTGESDFQMEVVEEGVMSSDKLGERERAWIEKLCTKFPNGLNAVDGGSTGRVEGIPTVVDDESFQSREAAAREVSKKSGLPIHVVRSRLAAGEPIPEQARKHSDHPEAGTILFRKWLGLKKRVRDGNTSPIVPEWDDYDTWKRDTDADDKEHLDFYRPIRDEPWGPTNFAWGTGDDRVTSVHGKELSAFGKVWPSRTAACKAFGIGKSTFEFRLKAGKTVEEALSQPLAATSRRGKSFIFEDENFRSITEAATVLGERYGISKEKARDRIRRAIPTQRWSSMSH